MATIVPCSKSDEKKTTWQEHSGGVISGTGGQVCPHWVPPGIDPEEWDAKKMNGEGIPCPRG